MSHCTRHRSLLPLWFLATCLTLFGFCLHRTADAQLPQTRLRSVFPAGGQAGQTFEFKLVSGDDLEEVTALYFTHPGIKATLKTRDVNGRAEPIDNTFDVTIAADVPVGIYEVRAVGLWGVSNPRRFMVGGLPESIEDNKNNTPAEASVIEVGTVVNGKMDAATDIDYFRLTAKKDEVVVVNCWAQRIDSVFAPVATVFDANGRQLGTSASRAEIDATVPFVAPVDGEYLVKLHDHTFGGGADYGYRLDVHRGPHVAIVYPPAGAAGTKGRFTLFGYNLPGGQSAGAALHRVPLQKLEVEIAIPGEPALLDVENYVRPFEVGVDAFSYRLSTPQGVSNPVRIGIAELPVVVEQEPNNEASQATPVTVPTEVAGQFQERGDLDWVTFDAKAGETFWLEVIGQRQGSTLDPVMTIEQVIVDDKGVQSAKRLSTQDDNASNVAPGLFDSQTDDPVFKFQIPADGKYRIGLYDRYRHARGDLTLAYRLIIRKEQPDFRVVAVPMVAVGTAGSMSAVNLRKGDTNGIDVFAFRRDGFDGPITVTAEGLPPGVTCAGTTLGTGEVAGKLVIVAADNAAEAIATIQLKATAAIDDPAKVQALTDAKKAVEAPDKALPDLRKKADDLRQKRDAAMTQRDDAKKASDEKPDDAGLKAELEKRQKGFDQAESAYQPVAEALAATEKTLADAAQAVIGAQAAQRAAVRQVSRSVREGTIAVNGANNVPARGRVSATVTVAVIQEAAPFQLVSEAVHVEACQSRQVLVPIELVKRNGFDDKVTLTVAGLNKNSNIQVANLTIEKGASKAIAQVQVKDNSPPGTYTFWFTSQAQVDYSRNPQKAERLTREKDQVAEALKGAQESQKQATDAKTKAMAEATAADNSLKQAQQEKMKADQTFQQREKDKVGAAKEVTTATDALAKLTGDVAEKEKAASEAKKQAEAEPENADAKTKLQQAEQAVEAAKKAVEAAQTALTGVQKKLTDAESLLKQAVEAQQVAITAVTAAEAAKQTADKTKTESETAEKTAIDAAKAADAALKAAEKLATDAATAAKPKKVNHTPMTSPIVIDVLTAPVKLAANVPNGGALKRGASIDVKVTATRLNGFAGPISLSLALPPDVKGLNGTIDIPADQTEGTLQITATNEAPEGEVKLLVIRGTVDAPNKQAVDIPVTLKITQYLRVLKWHLRMPTPRR